MGLSGILWGSVELNGILRDLSAIYGSEHSSMGRCGSHCVNSMGFYGAQWDPMGLNGILWGSVEVNGILRGLSANLWVSVRCCGSHCVNSVGFYGAEWDSMGLC